MLLAHEKRLGLVPHRRLEAIAVDPREIHDLLGQASRSLEDARRAVTGGLSTDWQAPMSEYPYHEFQAIDRPLTDREMAELRKLSTRAQITPTSFVNVYTWGNFRGSPARLMEK